MDKREIFYRKILNLEQLKRMLAFWRYKEQRIVMAYGTFDSLKPGNIEMLVSAANKGDALLVAIRSDEYLRRLKGAGYNAHNQFNRAYVLSSQLLVSGICYVNQNDIAELVDMVRPMVIACCSNASSEETGIFNKIRGWGGEVIQIDTSLTVEEVSPEGGDATPA